jgi:hypothetical protein
MLTTNILTKGVVLKKISVLIVAGILSVFLFNLTVQAKGKTTYTCLQQRQAGNAKVMTTFLNSMADQGYTFNHWDSSNFVMCFKK